MSKLLYLNASQLEIIEEGDNLFIKSFLVDSSINANKWAVTEQSLKENISSFIGKPIVLTPDFDHPKAKDGDALLEEQERFRIGSILSIGIEELSGKGWVIAEITDRKAIETISQQGINFVSPSIVFGEDDIMVQDGVEIVTKFEGAHLALVKDPAYGIQKAQIKGQCRGSKLTCLSQLQKVQASVEKSPCGNYLIVRKGSVENVLESSECTEKWINELQNTHPEWEIEQVIAVALSKCGESRKAECKVDQLGNCVTNSSLSENEDKDQLMTAQDDKEDEEKARKAQEDEEEKKKEEARKAQEDEEKKEEEARKAQEEEKEKDVDDIAKLKADLHDLEEKMKDATKEAQVKPIVDKIVSAKVKLNHIKESDSGKEFEVLVKLPTETLNQIAKQYESFNTGEKAYSVLNYNQASTETFEGDELLIKLGSVD